MHVYVWEHIVSFYYRTALWMFSKLGMDEVLIALHMHYYISAKSVQGQGKIGHGVPFFKRKKLLFQTEGYRNKPNAFAMILKHVE